MSDRFSILVVISAVLLMCACSAGISAEPASRIPANHAPLHIEIASAYKPLSECLSANVYTGPVSTALLARIDPDAFSKQAAEVIGIDHPAVQSSQDSHVERVRLLIIALATHYGQGQHTDADRALAMKAIALVGVRLAEADGNRCIPSPDPIGWMAQVPPVRH